jgi:hypothetical protein
VSFLEVFHKTSIKTSAAVYNGSPLKLAQAE